MALVQIRSAEKLGRFLDFLCQFDATDHHRCASKALQTQHRAQPLFNPPMVLFDHVVQIFVAPNS
jgi:hypothetical protein